MISRSRNYFSIHMLAYIDRAQSFGQLLAEGMLTPTQQFPRGYLVDGLPRAASLNTADLLMSCSVCVMAGHAAMLGERIEMSRMYSRFRAIA